MKKIQFLLLITGVTALFVTSCKGKDSVAGDDPKAVVTAFFERMSKKDIEGAAKLCTKESQGTLDLIKKGMDAAEKMKSDSLNVKEEDGFKDMIVGDAKINGENATVAITNKKENKTTEIPLKKEGGSWKVDFSMNTLMKMGMDESKDKDTDLFKDDNDNDTMDLNLDKMIDTINNELDKLKEEIK